MGRLYDILSPKGETIQIILKRKGKPVSGLYVDDKQEIRSPSLDKREDGQSDRKNQ
jgi:hypothetical protein